MELKNEEIMPSEEIDRDLSLFDYTLLWAGMTIGIAGFAVGAQLYPGISPNGIIIATIIAYGFVTLLLVLIGDIGMKYGLPFTVYMRACFGYKGAHIPGIIRTLPCLFWFGFQTWVGALALNEILEVTVGFSNLTIVLLIFAALQVFNAIYGLKAMAKFDWIAIPLLAIVLAITAVWLLDINNASINDVLAIKGDGTTAFSFAIAGVAGGWLTMALNGPDLTRKLKKPKDQKDDSLTFLQLNKNAIIGQIIGLIIVGGLVIFVGMISGVLTGTWNPIDVLVEAFESSNTFILIAAFLTIIFAQWSTNTVSNLMPPTYILINLFPKLTFANATIISGILGVGIMPWLFGDYLVYVQAITSGLLGPIAGIMIADYYFIRKRILNVDDFYTPDGPFKYNNNFNIASLISLISSCLIGLMLPDYSFFISLVLSIIIYTVLMKNNWFNKKNDQQQIKEQL